MFNNNNPPRNSMDRKSYEALIHRTDTKFTTTTTTTTTTTDVSNNYNNNNNNNNFTSSSSSSTSTLFFNNNIYNQSQNDTIKQEQHRMRDSMRQRDIKYNADMLRENTKKRQEYEDKKHSDTTGNLHSHIARYEENIEDEKFLDKQMKISMEEDGKVIDDELAALLKQIEITEAETEQEERAHKEKQDQLKQSSSNDGGSSNSQRQRRERVPPPRQFTPEETARIRDARGETNRNMTETVVEGFAVKINRRHLGTLSGLNWLNDEVINFYRELLQERELNAMKLENRPRQVWFTNTFFISKLSENGYTYRNVRRWTKRAKVDIFSLRLMLIPMNVGGSHWTCAGINFHEKTITYYDSMGGLGTSVLQLLHRYLKDEHENKKKCPLPNPDEWKMVSPGRRIPQQHNCSDCGVFSSQFLNYLSNNDPFDFAQQHMQNFRMKMCLEILNKKLFD